MTIDPIGVHPETGLPVYADNIGFKNGQPYVLSDEEYAQRQVDIGVDAAQRPMQDWLAQMQQSDNLMTRIEEDIIDALDDATKQRLNQEVMGKYNAKKALRGSKP
jgi:hypothetical protein